MIEWMDEWMKDKIIKPFPANPAKRGKRGRQSSSGARYSSQTRMHYCIYAWRPLRLSEAR
ncbi:MAG TPA: hypothetical protein VLM39_14240 [Ignavibacteriaceae bacterium]|nr:hypothetical protein [Ignavibacteriaceae bacterium]